MRLLPDVVKAEALLNSREMRRTINTKMPIDSIISTRVNAALGRAVGMNIQLRSNATNMSAAPAALAMEASAGQVIFRSARVAAWGAPLG
jgi:hypothetical protein